VAGVVEEEGEEEVEVGVTEAEEEVEVGVTEASLEEAVHLQLLARGSPEWVWSRAQNWSSYWDRHHNITIWTSDYSLLNFLYSCCKSNVCARAIWGETRVHGLCASRVIYL